MIRATPFEYLRPWDQASLVQSLCATIHTLVQPDADSYRLNNSVFLDSLPASATAVVVAHLHQVADGTFWQLLAVSDGTRLISHSLASQSATLTSAGARCAYFDEHELQYLDERGGMPAFLLLLDQAVVTYARAWQSALAGARAQIEVPIMQA